MVYVQRSSSGKIVGVYACLQPGYAEEEMSRDDPEVVAYFLGIQALGPKQAGQ